MEAESEKVKIIARYFRINDTVYRVRELEDGTPLDFEEVPVVLVGGYTKPWPWETPR